MARAQSDQDRMEAAAKDFRSACVVCHGPEGKGDGPYVSQLRTAPPNLRKLSARNGGIFPTQEVYQRIEGLAMPAAHGTRVMPVWGALFLFEEIGESVSIKDAQMAEQKTRRRLERLVDYLKSIQE